MQFQLRLGAVGADVARLIFQFRSQLMTRPEGSFAIVTGQTVTHRLLSARLRHIALARLLPAICRQVRTDCQADCFYVNHAYGPTS